MLFLSFIISACLNLAVLDFAAVSRDYPIRPEIYHQPFSQEPGYYFSLASTPLSENQYIFVATPLKKAYMIIDGQTINVSYTMTVKERKGFTDYFSGEKYNARLIIRDEIKSIEGVSDYRGILEIQHGSENRKFKIHGRSY